MQQVLFIRMPAGCKSVGRGKLVRITTPFDYTLVYEGIAVFLDCKRTEKTSFSYSDLTTHQVRSLATIERNGCTAGYLIFFVNLDHVVWFDAKYLWNMVSGSSLKPEDGVLLGSMTKFSLKSLFTRRMEHAAN